MSQPGLIDGFPFARAGSEVHGTLGPKQLPRLAEMGCGVQDELAYRVRGDLNDRGSPCLCVQAQGTLVLACRRCLEPIRFSLEVEVELVLAGSQREIEAAEDDVDRVLASRAMDVAELVEDEVILAVPMAPAHAACALDLAQARAARASPFEVLRQLKRH
ncbi:MAG: DUF177 domain-containing protein [Burkholderiales bacterium]|nr:DUF177 domain-containing protein [Burkholderiales bacterium]